MSRGKIIGAVIALFVVGGIVAAVAVGAQGGAPTVSTAKVAKGDLTVAVSAAGKIEAGAKADVYPSSAGVVKEVLVVDGQKVKANQVLAEMDTAPLKLQVEQARAGLSQATAARAAIDKQLPTKADKDAAAANVSAAWNAYDAARDAYEAMKDAYDAAPSSAKPSMEATLTSLNVAKQQAYAGYLGAKAAQAKLSVNVRTDQAAANAAVAQAELALKLAQDALAKATIYAPIDGTVLFNAIGAPGLDGVTPKIADGAAVAPQAAPFTVVHLGGLRFVAEVDEVDVERVEKGMAGSVTLDAFPGDSIETSVTEIRPTATLTPTGGTVFQVYLAVSDTAKRVLIGMRGDAEIQVGGVKDSLTIPFDALFEEDDEKFVYVVEGDILSKRVITTGVFTESRVQVVEGLKAGEVVALSGPVELKDGMSVRVKP